MAEDPANTVRSDPDGRADPDAHGQAALLLVESLIHGLIQKGTLSTEDALEIATGALEVKEAIMDDVTETRATAQRSLQMIARIIASLEFDRPAANGFRD
ncbi:hypothetical protein [Sphingomonas solaris]|uniref:Uncharacterized protein n=1 Tax=Alterirhizorhabdus solaris TaxID=2529389 RepID=A0A558RD92_9SPHN|nr:hypothetical protein [Sphingomonas solaris]TVV77346.1 hypothetical protein FOY91_00870 [Sphingomonas solaris]